MIAQFSQVTLENSIFDRKIQYIMTYQNITGTVFSHTNFATWSAVGADLFYEDVLPVHLVDDIRRAIGYLLDTC